jgi:large subunit ribosomal protein L21
VAPGDHILVDRLAAEPGSSLKLGRVLLFNDGNEVKVGDPAIDGLDVDVKVVGHRRGPRLESLRYKSKKRVRVHHGGRAHLTALEIVAIGGIGRETEEKEKTEKKRSEPKAAPRKRVATKAEASEAEAAPKATEQTTEAPTAKRATRRKSTKESK